MLFLYILLGLILFLSVFCLYLLDRVTKLRAQVLFLYKSVKQLEETVVTDWKKKVQDCKVPPPPTRNPFKGPPLGVKDIRHLQKTSGKIIPLFGRTPKK